MVCLTQCKLNDDESIYEILSVKLEEDYESKYPCIQESQYSNISSTLIKQKYFQLGDIPLHAMHYRVKKVEI